ncbi:MAG: hypothetical protein LBU89_05950 [Fibromonadaceae bacterium]|jgi:GR25 family glycosyltransferase involved in LPS biosynthesis|nr:hypothetical protein [Fibromonadaceae bacterium]
MTEMIKEFLQTPILFIIFNRPEYTRESFAAIRQAKPKKLYIAADGPRQGKEGEKELCEEARNLVLNSIDWDCEVKTRFQEKNLGCYLGVSSAISWLFENEEVGIILEDDVVANLSFLKYCEELLEKYGEEKQVWTISGYTWLEQMNTPESFCFVQRFSCWGWATWADRWKSHSLDLTNYNYANLKNIDNELARKFWMEILAIMQSDSPIDSWAYRYQLRGVEHNALHIIPNKNLCKNIGNYGTHSSGTNSYYHLPTFEIQEIIYPKTVELNNKIQLHLDEHFSKYEVPFPFPENCSIPKKRDVFLWGTGKDATKVLAQVKYNGYKVAAFVDSNKKRQDIKFNGYDVISPKELFEKKLSSYFIVIASTKYASEVAVELEENGLVKNKDYWRP